MSNIYKRGSGLNHPVDIYVGIRLRELREASGISQPNLAKTVGPTSQQLQKYDSGKNRISASVLYDLGRALHVDPAYFFEGYTPDETAPPVTLKSPLPPIPVSWSRLYLDLKPADRPAATKIIKSLIRLSQPATDKDSSAAPRTEQTNRPST